MNSQIIQKLEIETDAWCDANFPTNWTDRVDEFLPLWNKKFAELIVKECTGLLWNESERLYAYSSECNNERHSYEAELSAEKCLDNIKMLEEHFGVE